ncbi:MAG: VCBS repeat-containing protein [Bacteroidetes bacterium]|nr:VCBS repeat-containing protein [Bacteroidota bacterium]
MKYLIILLILLTNYSNAQELIQLIGLEVDEFKFENFNPLSNIKGIKYFADVTGDGKADAIVVNDDKITVRRSDGNKFLPNESWTTNPYNGYDGYYGNYFVDVTGDGKADAIVVDNDKITVRRSDGNKFISSEVWYSDYYIPGTIEYLTDLTGDGKAEAVGFYGDQVIILRSSGKKFIHKGIKSYKNYAPYKTIGIYRSGNSVEIRSVNYLLIPTKKGFKYSTLNVDESGTPSLDVSGLFWLDRSNIQPIFFSSKEGIKSFLRTLNPSLSEPYESDVQLFSYITPDFYTTRLSTSGSGRMLARNKDEQIRIHYYDLDKKGISSLVTDYLSNSEKNKIVINILKKMKEYKGVNIDTDYHMDYDTNEKKWIDIRSFKRVYFDFRFQNNGVYIIPYISLNDVANISYLTEGNVINNIGLYKKFKVKKAINDKGTIFISPDKSTKTVIDYNRISVYDNESNKLLAIYKHHFNKVVMSEYALGKYAKKWKNEFSDDLISRVEDINLEDIPQKIKVKGKLIIAKKWKDINGENLLIVSSRGPLPEPVQSSYAYALGEEFYVDLFAEQYILKDNKYKLLWDIHDFVRYCWGTLYIKLLPNSTLITDLDKDNITETTIIYKNTCRSDLSPSYMKILMHENNVKMGLRGFMRFSTKDENKDITYEMNLSKIDITGLNNYDKSWVPYGRYENENDFRNKPIDFLKFARKKWKEFSIEGIVPKSDYNFFNPK